MQSPIQLRLLANSRAWRCALESLWRSLTPQVHRSGHRAQWSQRYGNSAEQGSDDMAVGSDRVIALSGGYAGAVRLGGAALPSQSAPGAFIARFAQ